MVGKNEGNYGVVGLPEGTDEEERHTYEYDSFVVEFHSFSFRMDNILNYLIITQF